MMIGKKDKKNSKKNSNPNGRVCGNCSAPEESESLPKLSACARCCLVFYCSRDCQRAHWKANHKQHCIAKINRAPQVQNLAETFKGADLSAAASGEKCAICQDLLRNESSFTLSCTHTFHGNCVAQLRKFGVKQVCPLCRTPLPPGPERVFEDATRRYMVILRLVERGHASWSALPASAQSHLDAAVTGWQTAADEGLVSAQYAMGIAFDKGRGVAQCNVEAVRYYRKATDQGHVDALYNLGLMFEEGRGVAQSDEEAVRLWRKAANQGNTAAQCNLGVMLETGRGVAKNHKEAVRWYRKAADQGHAGAQYNLGVMFQNGRGVAQSDEDAAEWYRKAADQGHMVAQCRLAQVLSADRGTAHAEVE